MREDTHTAHRVTPSGVRHFVCHDTEQRRGPPAACTATHVHGRDASTSFDKRGVDLGAHVLQDAGGCFQVVVDIGTGERRQRTAATKRNNNTTTTTTEKKKNKKHESCVWRSSTAPTPPHSPGAQACRTYFGRNPSHTAYCSGAATDVNVSLAHTSMASRTAFSSGGKEAKPRGHRNMNECVEARGCCWQ